MAGVIFNYEGTYISVQCNTNEGVVGVIKRFLLKIGKREDNKLNYLYNGILIDKNLTFNEQANELDKKQKMMNILVTDINSIRNEVKPLMSKDIICPECEENIFIEIKNFKINFHGCKNNHNINNISLFNYEDTQIIDNNKIICDICKLNNNNNNTFNFKFYICTTCNKNICPLCKSIHERNHKIISYDDKNYICKIHNESFIKYCKTCNDNICIICEKNHKNHDIFELSKILINKEDLIRTNENLKNIIGNFNYKVNLIKEVLGKMVKLLDAYYKINNEIVNNYNMNKRNYHILKNLNYLKK